MLSSILTGTQDCLVASNLAIFQCTTETVLRDLPMVVVYRDNILVNERSQEEHFADLVQVLQ